ncbi:valine--tRNA ligase [Candidatus Wolfebacteria bacterium]|nr:valine--tRNA ligase [Candidatus Wolfebacteria bacterium]
MDKFSKPYNPKEIEDKIYELWEKSGYFNPDKLPAGKRKKTFVITAPPPNITGTLHMGHALNAVVQDILIRKKRMEGYKTLWLPGIDHAGIATQNVVEKELRKQGTSRHELGKEEFLKRVWEWKEKYGDIILNQLKKIGSSMDWSRTRFTMDAGYQEAVKEAFSAYYKKGWIYQAERVINWCLRCHTSLSDLELEYKEESANLYYIKYPLADNSGFIVVATTRPETMLGDSAVAVNPKDQRYKKLIGKEVILPIKNRKIPVIADRLIDLKFGTGAVKVTPAHDMADSEIGSRHNLKVYKIIDSRGKMTSEAGVICEGLKSGECRIKVIDELKSKSLIEKEESYKHNIAVCSRCGAIIEPIPSLQWFLKMNELAKIAIKSVKSGKIKFHPKRWEKVYFDWLGNIKDWCISRQIWWGHKLPIEGEDDVLDTWFSSALWPFAVFGWPLDSTRDKPKKGSDLDRFYPTNVLSTARDIINLWVARMIFSGVKFMKKEPFKDVIIHATILTKDGKRMSKSLGTGVDPIDLIENYGADATRFGLIWQAMGSQDIHWAEEHVLAGKKFANKIWNASRFVIQQIEISNFQFSISKKLRLNTAADKKILIQLQKTKKSVEKLIDKYEFGPALHELHKFFWNDFCDKYIETGKKQMEDGKFKDSTKKVLIYVLLNSLKLLHPFMPFITEEIWQNLSGNPPAGGNKMLIIEKW